MYKALILVICITIIAGCAKTPVQPPSDSRAADAAILNLSPHWQTSGLASQWRMTQLATQTQQNDLGFKPQTTGWRSTNWQEKPDTLAMSDLDNSTITATSPGVLLITIAQLMHLPDNLGQDTWEMTFRVVSQDDSSASGIIMVWGFKDDSLAGSDILIKMKKQDIEWAIDEILERSHCYRGIASDGLCI